MDTADNYSDIIDLPRPALRTRPRMTMRDRAAQFSPFSALTGYEDEVRETARFTDEKLVLTEDRERELNEKFALLSALAPERPLISVKYFIPDKKKAGGKYAFVKGNFRRFDEYSGQLVLTDGTGIPFENILDMELTV